MRSLAPRRAGLFAAVALVFAGCSGGSSTDDRPATEFVHVHGLGVDPSQPNALWVATHRGLIRGVDDGGWVYASRDRNDYMGFTLDPGSGTLFRSGHPEAGGSLGVESSTDGRSWDHLADVLSPPADFHAMTLSLADPSVMYGWDSGGRGLFRSTDGGRTWSLLPAPGPQVLSLAAPKEEGVVLAGTTSGLFASRDGGRSWGRLGAPSEGAVLAIASNPRDPKHLVAFAQEGMRVSRDGGTTWTVSEGIGAEEFVGAIAVSPADGDAVYAAAATTLYRSTDGGTRWRTIRSGP